MISPWFGRAALTWVVDMSALGVTIAYFYTCLCAFRMFRRTGEPARPGELDATESTLKKGLSLLGALVAVTFAALLLVPGSPALLGQESLTALVVWVVLGVVFFLTRYRHFKSVPSEQLDELVLGKPRPEFMVAQRD